MSDDALKTGLIAIVGGGNMAEALLRGLIATGSVLPEKLRVSDPSAERQRYLHEAHGVQVSADNAVVADGATVVLLAIKPDVLGQALSSIRDVVAPTTLIVSVVAGAPTGLIEAALPAGSKVIRAMPNAPALAGAGATALAPGSRTDAASLSLARRLFEAVGRCVVVHESMMDAVTGLSGSGPAYVMLLIEALADGGVREGLPRATALELAAQTVYGAAKLQLETGEHPAVLRDRVTSPGGTTSAGLASLEASGVRGAVIAAVQAAARRSAELGSAG